MESVKVCIIILLFLGHSLFSISQVTIGSGMPPTRTSLLQLKDHEPDENNSTASRGGLLLPRVGLVNLKTLQPFIEPTDTEYNSQKKNSVGLLVFNTVAIDSISPGLYYWDGEQWEKLMVLDPQPGGGVDPVEPDIPTDPENPDALKLSNSYIVNSGKTVDIPVIKGYAVWMQILNADRTSLDGQISVELAWQDHSELISRVTLAQGDKGAESMIRLTTNNKKYSGNAVIVLKINDLVYWSWHIWVTDYNPSAPNEQYVYNGYTFMNRNLGTTLVNPGGIGSKGLLYQ